MQPQDRDRDELIDVSFRFVSWLRNHFPEIKEEVIGRSMYDSFGEWIKKTPILFWSEIGRIDYDRLTIKSLEGESILDRIIFIVKDVKPEVRNELLVGFVEGHMWLRPDSPLAKEMGEALGIDLSGLC